MQKMQFLIDSGFLNFDRTIESDQESHSGQMAVR